MNLYARELIRGWVHEFPDDEVAVVGGDWLLGFKDSLGIETHIIRSESTLTRIRTQLSYTGVLARRLKADALLSLSPVSSPFFPSKSRAVVVHDWRHKRRPKEFPRTQRTYRQMWPLSIRFAGVSIAISEKTAEETRRYAKPKRLVVVENGGDHPASWTRVERDPGPPFVLTYGHLVNKRPEAVIAAIQVLKRRGRAPRLKVLGASGAYRTELEHVARDLDVHDLVDFPGFVDDRTYQELVQTASAIVLNSSDEGFGLPVVEAAYFSVPAIVALDSGLPEIHGDRVIAVSPDAESIATALAHASDSSQVRAAAPYATWAECATRIRTALT